MAKKIISLLLLVLIISGISMSAFADAKKGYVTFTSAAKMAEENFDIDQVFSSLEPGDNAEYQVEIRNDHPQTTRWYMSNKVIASLEESAAKGKIFGGAYDYVLTYKGPSGKLTTIYDSRSPEYSAGYVGGDAEVDNRVGMEKATGALEDYFFLDTLNSKDTGTVTLRVFLEGETQDNLYQNTAARIKMNFAVELSNNSPPGSSTRTAVKTGDENNLTPYYVGMVIAGLLLLYFALDEVTDRMYKKGRR
jgi:hypothetical protein